MPDNKAFQKKANISLVMQTIRIKKQISRIDISRELKLDRSTITNIVSKLLESGLLVELSEGVSVAKGGRKPVLLGINPLFGVVLGLEIQVNFYRATLLNFDGTIIWSREEKLEGEKELYSNITDIYKSLEDEINKESAPLLGIGIGVPGHINPIEGKILSSSPFYMPTEGYKETLSNLFDIPVILDNDANCCAWGVLEQRKETGLKNFLYSIIEFHGNDITTTEKEIGFGIVVNGQVYYGSSYAAGELWNSLIDRDSLESGLDYENYFKELFDKLSLFVSFLNPSHLFLGGEFMSHQDLVLKVLKESPLNNGECEIVFSCHKEYEVSFGAASMFLERLFKVPGVDDSVEPELTWAKILDIRSTKGGDL